MPVVAVVNPSYGIKLKHGTGSPGSYTYAAIAQITDLDGPSREVGTRETTNLDSVAKTFAATLLDGGEVSGTIEYDPKSDSHVILDGLMATPTSDVPWQIALPDSANGPSTMTFLGVLTKFAPTGMKREENLLAAFSIKVSGLVVVA